MWKKIIQLISGKECELRERMFRTIILIGAFATMAAVIQNMIEAGKNNILLPLLIMLFVIILFLWILTFKYEKYKFASTLLGIIIIAIVMPVMFFKNGGTDSGAEVWLVIGILYLFVMYSGKRLFFFLMMCIGIYIGTYGAAYFYPELLSMVVSREAIYLDSLISVVAAGLIGGVILKVHMRVFEEEHRINIAQKEELERSRDSKNTFFANMSHEIRTPINAIIGLNEMIMRANPDGVTREYAKDIQAASKMLLNQVNDILDLSQMEMQKMNIIPVKYSTENLFGELIELMQVQLEKKALEFYIDIDRNLPSILFGDERRLKQVLLNILDNAVKYTEAGSVMLSAQGEVIGEDELILKVQVADTGIGIRKEDMDHIYDSFNRADEKRNTRILGSGLGLAITKQLVDLMEGEITIDSIYTKGTTFSVILKQKIVDSKPIGVVDFQEREGEAGEYYQPCFEAPEARVLVVDDNDMNLMVAKGLLEPTKMQVDVAGSGMECLELTKKKYYHVILLDYMMPGMNGPETLEALRNQENGLCRDTAVITITGNAMSGARQLYREQGFDGFVEKPIQGKTLEREILQFLPPDIIEYQESESVDVESISQMQKIARRKRKKVYITADCTCDIPTELLEKYDIKLMYLYIRTPYGRFADTREIDSDSLTQYMSADCSNAYADSVTVEEFEEFFAEALTQAESVIHISLGSRAGRSHGIAVAAAKGFDYVHVIDSGQISSGQGLVTLYAAKLAMEGKSVSEICEEVLKMRAHVQMGIIMPGADIFYQNGRTSAMVAKLCRMLQLHPFVIMRQKNAIVAGLLGGSLENAWKRGIRWHLRNKRKINHDIVFISHVGCSVKQQEWIKKEVLKRVPFGRVIIQKASFTVACNSGMETIGISYYSL